MLSLKSLYILCISKSYKKLNIVLERYCTISYHHHYLTQQWFASLSITNRSKTFFLYHLPLILPHKDCLANPCIPNLGSSVKSTSSPTNPTSPTALLPSAAAMQYRTPLIMINTIGSVGIYGTLISVLSPQPFPSPREICLYSDSHCSLLCSTAARFSPLPSPKPTPPPFSSLDTS